MQARAFLRLRKENMERNGEIIVVKAGSSSVSNNEVGLNSQFLDAVAEQLS